MIELVDWDDLEPQPPGTPGWWTLAITLRGNTRRPPDRVFAAVEHHPDAGTCHVILAADIPDTGPEVLEPFEIQVRLTIEGVATYIVSGATKREECRASTP